MVFETFIHLIVILVFLLIVTIFAFRKFFTYRRKALNGLRRRKTVAFFHPYCNAGGGGERVLWSAVRAIQTRITQETWHIVIYTGDIEASPDQIITKARQRFGIAIPHPKHVEFVFLRWRKLVEAEMYPRFTLLGQTLGGFILGLEALWKYVPHVFVDSMGYPATLPLFRWIAGCNVGCYVHYPMISTDMITQVHGAEQSFNNNVTISASPMLTSCKLLYYKLFAKVYGFLGRGATVVMVNSSWTEKHIASLWHHPKRISVVYPPCDVETFIAVKNTSETKLSDEKWCRLLTIGQFRPEKNHELQLRALKHLVDSSGHNGIRFTLVFVGSVRHQDDEERQKSLIKLANQLNIPENAVEFKVNASFDVLKQECSMATFGLHSMVNEHFGIGVVEGLAAGNIMIAHDSGGPKMDILRCDDGETVGFLASTAEQYAECVLKVLEFTPMERHEIRRAARYKCKEYSEEKFEIGFVKAMSCMM